MAATNRRPPFPKSKISEVFLEFAEPLLGEAPRGATREQLTAALTVAFTAWNAVIYADVVNEPAYLKWIQRLLRTKPEGMAMLNQMVERKRTLFGNDHRLIGNWEITAGTDGPLLRAEARDPYTDHGSRDGDGERRRIRAPK